MLGFSAVVGCSSIFSRVKSRAKQIVLDRSRAAAHKKNEMLDHDTHLLLADRLFCWLVIPHVVF